MRELVHEIFDGKCGRCFQEENLHIHHIDRDPSNNSLENLELLDFWCHWEEHDFRDDMLDWFLKHQLENERK